MNMSSSSDNLCPGCKSPSVPEPQDTFFDFASNKVSRSDGSEISYKKATTMYLEEYFPHHATISYEVPPAKIYSLDGRLDFVKNDDLDQQLSCLTEGKKWKGPKTRENIMEERKQTDAVAKVASNFYTLGKDILGPMFVLTDYKFLNFARKSTEQKKHKRSLYGDHDIMIISRREGVIFIQVKSVMSADTRTCRQELHDAFTVQLPKDEIAVKYMNQDLIFVRTLPVQKFVGVPNIKDGDLSAIALCNIHRKSVITEDKLNKEQFQGFLSERFTQVKNDKYVLDMKQYKELVSRYVGLLSSVKLRSVSDVNRNVGAKVARILLNPDQLQCLKKDATRNIILGHFGTGKSILLMKKAEELAKKGEKVRVISFSCVHDDRLTVQPTDIDNLEGYLKKMQTSSKEDNSLVVESFNKHIDKEKTLKEIKVTSSLICDIIKKIARESTVHFFFDELPLGVFPSIEDWEKLEDSCNLINSGSVYLWIAISSTSIIPHKEKGFQTYEDNLPKSFEKTYLTRWMRVPRTVYKLIETVSNLSGENSTGLGSHGNVLDGPRHWWFELEACSCNSSEAPLKCFCVGPKRLNRVLKKILGLLPRTSMNDIIIVLQDISVEIKNFLTEITQDACYPDIPYRLCGHGLGGKSTLGEKSDAAITVGNVRSLKGNESKIVIYLDPYGGQLLSNVGHQLHGRYFLRSFTFAASRCLSQCIFITWPKAEKLSFDKKLVEHKLQNNPYVESLLSDGENLMEKLLNENLIEKVDF